jgi:hypothetical protein
MTEKVKCYRCNGSGRDPVSIVDIIFSLGLALADRYNACIVCKGNGFREIQ